MSSVIGNWLFSNLILPWRMVLHIGLRLYPTPFCVKYHSLGRDITITKVSMQLLLHSSLTTCKCGSQACMSMFRLKKDTCTNEPGVRSYIHRAFHTGSQRNLEISGRDAILKGLDQRMLHSYVVVTLFYLPLAILDLLPQTSEGTSLWVQRTA